jgi:nucleoside-diphosphate-sugar epimerase
MKKILITGASGFIGSHLNKVLKKKNYKTIPLGFNHIKNDLIKCDLLNKSKLENLLSDVECIIHCAGYNNTSKSLSFKQEKKIWKNNYLVSKNLIKSAKNMNVKKFIFLSSSKVVRENSKQKINENINPSPQTEYAKSKLMSEKFILKYGNKNGIDVICLRPTLVYGTGCKNFINTIYNLTKINIMLNFNKINNLISLIHIEDLCEAIIKVMTSNKKKQKIFLLTGPKNISISEICFLIKNFSSKKILKINLSYNFLLRINYILKKSKYISFFVKITNLIDKVLASSCYTSDKFTKLYNWKPKIYPFNGFKKMIKNK